MNEDVVDKDLEGHRCVGQAKGHDQEFVLAIPSVERYFGNVFVFDTDLPITAGEIDFGEKTCVSELVDTFLDSRNRIPVLVHSCVKFAIIDTHSPSIIWFLDE